MSSFDLLLILLREFRMYCLHLTFFRIWNFPHNFSHLFSTEICKRVHSFSYSLNYSEHLGYLCLQVYFGWEMLLKLAFNVFLNVEIDFFLDHSPMLVCFSIKQSSEEVTNFFIFTVFVVRPLDKLSKVFNLSNKFFQLDFFFLSTEFGNLVGQVADFGCIHQVTFTFNLFSDTSEVISLYHTLFFKKFVA
jgi:hypothetical protein